MFLKFFILVSIFIPISLQAGLMYEVEIDRITNPSDGVQFDRIVISIDPDQIPTKDQLINVHINKEYIRYILTHTLTWLDQNYQKHGKMKKEKDKEHLHEGLYQYPKITNEKSLHNDLFFNRINYLKKKFIVATNEIQNSKGHQKSDSKRKLSKKIMTEMYKAVDDRLQIQVKLSTYSALSKDRIDYYLKKKCHIIIFSSPNNISSIWSTLMIYDLDVEEIYKNEFEHLTGSQSHKLLIKRLMEIELKRKKITLTKMKYFSNYNGKHSHNNKKYDFYNAIIETIKEKKELIFSSESNQSRALIYLDCFKSMIPIYKAMGFVPIPPLIGTKKSGLKESAIDMYTTVNTFLEGFQYFIDGNNNWNPSFDPNIEGLFYLPGLQDRYTKKEIVMLKLFMKARKNKIQISVQNKRQIKWNEPWKLESIRQDLPDYTNPELPPPWIISKEESHCLRSIDSLLGIKPLY